jgi:hypothetical protein
MIDPFSVHSGLRYIKDELGPTTDLLWRRKIIPETNVSTPIMDRALPKESYDLTG